MVDSLTRLLEQLLRIPPPPEPPPGDCSSARCFRAAPSYYMYLMLVWGLKTLGTAAGLISWLALMMPALVHGTRKWGWDQWALMVAAIEVFGLIGTVAYWGYSWFVVRLDYDKRWYMLTDRSLRIREGIFSVREATVSFANIQNISISQGPIQRLLGIADLRVDTAGGGNSQPSHRPSRHRFLFRGVNNANQIRELMQERLKCLKDSGLGDPDDWAGESIPARAKLLDALWQVYVESTHLREAASRLSPQSTTNHR